MANVLPANAAISCPHGGTASLQSMQTRVAASGQIVADLSGRWVITGCSFTVGDRPQPCVTVHWNYHRDPGVRTRAQRCYARLYGGLPQYRRNCPRSADHRGCAAAGHGSRSTTLWNPLVVRRGRLAALVVVDWPPSFPLRHRPAPLGWSSRSVMARCVNKVTPHTGRR